MRTLRLGRTFDVVFIHDAISYLTSEADSPRGLETAFVHRPGGVVILTPDATTEIFNRRPITAGTTATTGAACATSSGRTHRSRARRPTSPTTRSSRAAPCDELRLVHDQHTLGLFPEATWRD